MKTNLRAYRKVSLPKNQKAAKEEILKLIPEKLDLEQQAAVFTKKIGDIDGRLKALFDMLPPDEEIVVLGKAYHWEEAQAIDKEVFDTEAFAKMIKKEHPDIYKDYHDKCTYIKKDKIKNPRLASKKAQNLDMSQN